jgi:hypothetical protein
MVPLALFRDDWLVFAEMGHEACLCKRLVEAHHPCFVRDLRLSSNGRAAVNKVGVQPGSRVSFRKRRSSVRLEPSI